MRFLLAACISSLAIISSSAQDEDQLRVVRAHAGSPLAWSPPYKVMNGGGWYPGLEHAEGTDKHAGRRARFFVAGRSDRFIEFSR